jgi:Zn-dependent peptidase ImmA (M78 family)
MNMQFSLTKIRQLFPNFNERAISEHEFWRAAKKEKIIVRSMPLHVDGYYQQKNGKHYILINSGLQGPKWLHTALHEFCHYLFDAPGANSQALYRKQCGDAEDPRERFADAFALICILPFSELLELQKEDLSDNPALGMLVRGRFGALSDFGM